eukprot:Nk52_evm90s151 gene=Nk52_evmTU90s151
MITAQCRPLGGMCTSEEQESQPYRQLFIGDILRGKGKILPGGGNCAARVAVLIGDPTICVQRASVSGIITSVATKDKGVTEGGIFHYFMLDDSTGLIQVKVSPTVYVHTELKPGMYVEVLGHFQKIHPQLKEMGMEANAVSIKNDPMFEPMRYLETVQVYKDVYFKNRKLAKNAFDSKQCNEEGNSKGDLKVLKPSPKKKPTAASNVNPPIPPASSAVNASPLASDSFFCSQISEDDEGNINDLANEIADHVRKHLTSSEKQQGMCKQEIVEFFSSRNHSVEEIDEAINQLLLGGLMYSNSGNFMPL